jgi:hypothetical protein
MVVFRSVSYSSCINACSSSMIYSGILPIEYSLGINENLMIKYICKILYASNFMYEILL